MEENQERIIHFIKTVENYPCLWNQTLDEYKTNEVKQAAWRNIINHCEISNVNEARHLWKKLRDGYRQAMSRRTSKRTTSWKYEKVMSFLNLNKFSSSFTTESTDTITCQSDFGATNETDEEVYNYSKQPRKKRRKKENYEIQFMKSEHKCSEPERVMINDEVLIAEPEDSALKKFFDSMFETCKALPEYLQIQVQRSVFNVVMEAREENLRNPFKT